MDSTIGAAIVGGVFTLANAPLMAVAAKWARNAHHVGTENAKELDRMSRRLDSRQDSMIRDAVKQYVRDNPGMIDSAVAHEAMRDLLFELVSLHLDEEEVRDLKATHGRGDRRT